MQKDAQDESSGFLVVAIWQALVAMDESTGGISCSDMYNSQFMHTLFSMEDCHITSIRDILSTMLKSSDCEDEALPRC